MREGKVVACTRLRRDWLAYIGTPVRIASVARFVVSDEGRTAEKENSPEAACICMQLSTDARFAFTYIFPRLRFRLSASDDRRNSMYHF